MCGRFKLSSEEDILHAEFGIVVAQDHRPRYNIAPTQDVLAILSDGERLRPARLRWGLIPQWEEKPANGAKRINARAETLLQKPSFREAFERRRCLILADGFYEWLRDGKTRRPMLIQRPDSRPFAFAGLWERWRRGEERIFSCTIITVPPAEVVRPIHDRMPLLLQRADQENWLDAAASMDTLQRMMQPYSGPLEAFPVSSLVNSPVNDSPQLVEPV